MKRLIFILFILSAWMANAGGEKQLLEEANRHYTAQEYREAAEKYEQILASGKESAELYFNLGNACFKNGDHVKAILNYERAKMLAPQNEDIDFNLQIANQFVVDNLEQLPKPFFARWWSNLADNSSADGWAKISTWSFLIFLVFLGTYLFSRSTSLKKAAFFSAVGVLVLMLLSFSLAWHQYGSIRQRNAAIVQCPRVTIKSAPSPTGTDLFLIHEGLKVQITDSLDSWKEVELSDGNKGWLKDSCLVRI